MKSSLKKKKLISHPICKPGFPGFLGKSEALLTPATIILCTCRLALSFLQAPPSPITHTLCPRNKVMIQTFHLNQHTSEIERGMLFITTNKPACPGKLEHTLLNYRVGVLGIVGSHITGFLPHKCSTNVNNKWYSLTICLVC